MTRQLDGRMFGDDQPCFGCGPNHPFGFRLSFRQEGDEVVTRFVPTERHQGLPGIMHGGLIVTLADETAAWVLVAFLDTLGFTATSSAKYRRPVRIGVEIEGRGRIVRNERRLVDVAVEIRQEGAAAFSGKFRFVIPDRAGAEKILGRPLSDDWGRFTRGSASPR